jgi:hypothetical protein
VLRKFPNKKLKPGELIMARENVGQVSRSTSAGLATAAVVCFAYSALALLLLHLLRPDYTPATNFISNYAVGRYGWIMTTWFLAETVGFWIYRISSSADHPFNSRWVATCK